MRTRPVLTLLLATAALGACGGDDVDEPAAGDRSDKAELAFARCMRSEGIDVPDPTGGGGPQRLELKRGTSPARVQAATEECRDKTGGGPRELSEAEQTAFRDAAVRFARCMRENGIDLPDPQTNGGGIVIQGRRGGATGASPVDGAFRKAEAACRKLLPEPPGGGADGGVSHSVAP